MKKIILTVAAVLAFGFANAQEVKFGIKGAANISTLTGDIENADYKFGGAIGVFAELKLSDSFSVQPELLYSMQGAENNYSLVTTGYSGEFKDKWTLSYINLPVMAKYYVIEKLSLEAGPQIGFLITSEIKQEASETNGGVTQTRTETVDFKSKTNSIDFGLNFGAGFDFSENFSAGVRYNVGLTNISKVQAKSEGQTDSMNMGTNVKNSVLSISLGYKF